MKRFMLIVAAVIVAAVALLFGVGQFAGPPVALAIVKRPHNLPGSQVRIGEVDAEVVALPFVA